MNGVNFQEIIDWVKQQLREEVIVSKETHGDRSDVFIVNTPDKKYFLKIGNDLKKEYDRLRWLEGRLPVPKAIAFKIIEDREALLLSGMEGKNLKVLSKEWPAEKVVEKFAAAIRTFHNMESSQFPFGKHKDGDVFIHGDASLPNFIFEGDKFSGYIDLGDMTIGDKETDFAAAIWSLQYNLGKGYGKMFLEIYGLTNITEEIVERLRLKYEDMQEAWGL